MNDGAAFEGTHATVKIGALGERVFVVRITGRDVGEHGDQPMKALAKILPPQRAVELYIDARDALGPSTDVSAAWAQWLAANRDAFLQISMLTGSSFVALTASFVRKWADLGDRMRVYTDAAAFEAALASSLTRP